MSAQTSVLTSPYPPDFTPEMIARLEAEEPQPCFLSLYSEYCDRLHQHGEQKKALRANVCGRWVTFKQCKQGHIWKQHPYRCMLGTCPWCAKSEAWLRFKDLKIHLDSAPPLVTTIEIEHEELATEIGTGGVTCENLRRYMKQLKRQGLRKGALTIVTAGVREDEKGWLTLVFKVMFFGEIPASQKMDWAWPESEFTFRSVRREHMALALQTTLAPVLPEDDSVRADMEHEFGGIHRYFALVPPEKRKRGGAKIVSNSSPQEVHTILGGSHDRDLCPKCHEPAIRVSELVEAGKINLLSYQIPWRPMRV